MTVTYSLVAIASRGAYAPISEADTTYVALKSVAQARLDNDNPGLPTALYDWCHALMITHMAKSDETAGWKSYSTEQLSVSKDPGVTVFLLEYQQIIDGYAESVDYSSESDVTRCDADMAEFHLDQADVPGYFCEG